MRIESSRQTLGNAGGANVISDVAFRVDGIQSEGAESLGENLTRMLAGKYERR